MSVSVKERQDYVLRLGDNALILGQQVSAWCGHAPALEEDIAFANVALDLIGQATLWLNYASELDAGITEDAGEQGAGGRSADDLAFLRGEREFTNVLLVEQPNGDFGQSLMRQFLFDAYHYPLLGELASSQDARIKEIAQKSLKEVTYHLERSTDLIIRLGNGTGESREYMQRALTFLWPFCAELSLVDALDEKMLEAGIGADMAKLKAGFAAQTDAVFQKAGLEIPEKSTRPATGRQGVHSEHMGRILAEMQYLQRAYPGMNW